MKRRSASLIVAAFAALPLHASAAKTAADESQESPWIPVPILTSSPKLGMSAGASLNYLHQFDPQSTPSIAGVSATYSDSQSLVIKAYASTYWNGNRDRLIGGGVLGRVNNEYKDFLGSGQPFNTTDHLKFFGLRYTHEVAPHWLLGAQFMHGNYRIDSDSPENNLQLEHLNLTGVKSSGLGPVLIYDTLDNQTMPTRGVYAQMSSMLFRKGFGGDSDYESYNAQVRYYQRLESGPLTGLVWANQLRTQWMADAPNSAWASVALRGYARGQYLAPGMSSLQSELRGELNEKWGWTAFAGAAILYGDGKDDHRIYPSVGAGVQYFIRRKAGRLINLDVAAGSSGNYGINLKLGYGF